MEQFNEIAFTFNGTIAYMMPIRCCTMLYDAVKLGENPALPGPITTIYCVGLCKVHFSNFFVGKILAILVLMIVLCVR